MRLSSRSAAGLLAILVIAMMICSLVLGGTSARADDTTSTDPAAVDTTTTDTTGTDAAATTEPAASQETVPAQPEPAAPAPAPAPKPAPAPAPVEENVVQTPSETVPQVSDTKKEASAEESKAAVVQAEWTTPSTLEIVPAACYTSGGALVGIDYNNFVYNIVDDVRINLLTVNGVATNDDFSGTFAAGSYPFTYLVTNQEQFSENSGKTVEKNGEFTVEACVVDPIEAPAPTQAAGSPDVVITAKDGVEYFNTATNAVVAGTVTLADKETIQIGARPSGDVPVTGGPWSFSYTAPVVESKFVIVLWKVADSDGNGDMWEQNTPKDGSWSLATNSTSLSQLDHLATQCGKYQVDLYWNSKTTSSLINGGVLYGPNNPKEDLAYGAVYGNPYKTFTVSNCDITVPERIPMFLDACGVDQDEVMVPADGENYRFVTVDNRVNGVGLVTVDLVANEGYTIPEGVTTHWEHEFTNEPCLIEVEVPPMPAYVDECGPDNIHWTLLGQEGVVWTFNDDGSITATPAEGYKFKGEEQSVTHRLPADSNESCVVIIEVPGTPGATDECGPNNIRWTAVPTSTDQVEWVKNLDGSLTATAKDGFIFAGGKQSVTFTLPADSNEACPATVVPPANPTSSLAVTGGTVQAPVIWGAAFALLLGAALVRMARRRQTAE
jgi:hypothetical protein